MKYTVELPLVPTSLDTAGRSERTAGMSEGVGLAHHLRYVPRCGIKRCSTSFHQGQLRAQNHCASVITTRGRTSR